MADPTIATDWATVGINALATLVAAFGGAFLAFLLENRRQRRRVESARQNALDQALFRLALQANELLLIKAQGTGLHSSDPARHIAMRPTWTRDASRLAFDVSEISFLIEFKEGTLLRDLSVWNDQFMQAIQLLNHRSELHLGEVQPILDKAGVPPSGTYVLSELETLLGPRLTAIMKELTDELVTAVEGAIETVFDRADRLHAVAKENFPKRDFIKPGRPSSETQEPSA